MKTPQRGCRFSAFQVALGALLVGPLAVASAQIKQPTVENAMAVSQQTGRPIFAMAGRET